MPIGDFNSNNTLEIFQPGNSVAGYQIVKQLTTGVSPLFQVHLPNQADKGLQVVFPGSSAAWQHYPRAMLNRLRYLRHPSLARVEKVIQCEGILCYLTTLPDEGLLAGNLPSYLHSPLSAAGLIEQVARAVHEMHMGGFLHRNLNLHSIGFYNRMTPLVIDYSVVMNGWRRADYLEQQGQIIGDVHYTAPEQVFARRQAIGPSTDVYSLGVILYQLLTGVLPIEGEARQVLGLMDTLAPPPLREIQPDIPQALEAITLRCLQKRSQDRYPSAELLADELCRFLNRTPPQLSLWGRIRRWIRRTLAP